MFMAVYLCLMVVHIQDIYYDSAVVAIAKFFNKSKFLIGDISGLKLLLIFNL